MAVKKKKGAGQAPRGGNLIAAAMADIEDLLKKHMNDGIIPLVDESEDHKATVSLSIKINCAESEPTVETDIRYTSSVTDRRVTKLDHPDQGTFKPVIEEAVKEAKKRREKAIGGEQPELPDGEEQPPHNPPGRADEGSAAMTGEAAPKKRGRKNKGE